MSSGRIKPKPIRYLNGSTALILIQVALVPAVILPTPIFSFSKNFCNPLILVANHQQQSVNQVPTLLILTLNRPNVTLISSNILNNLIKLAYPLNS